VGQAVVNNVTYNTHWGVDYLTATAGGLVVPGLLQPYVKSAGLFNDPSGPRGNANVDYMYNDYLSAKSQAALAGVAQTVLTCDGTGVDPRAASTVTQPAAGGTVAGTTLPQSAARIGAGHALLATGAYTAGTDFLNAAAAGARDQARFDDVIRHSEGGNFSFADGHVKWFKVTTGVPTGPGNVAITNPAGNANTRTVYFPNVLATNSSANAPTNEPVRVATCRATRPRST
jgi:prepilin-type processing-associated H-X9-DG protein